MIYQYGIRSLSATTPALIDTGSLTGVTAQAVIAAKSSGLNLWLWSDAAWKFALVGDTLANFTTAAFTVPANTYFCMGSNVDCGKIYIASSTGSPDLKMFISDRMP